MVRRADHETDPARRLSKRGAAESRHPGIHRCPSRVSDAVRLDEVGRRDPREHRSIRPADRRRAGRATNVTNHGYGTLGPSLEPTTSATHTHGILYQKERTGVPTK